MKKLLSVFFLTVIFFACRKDNPPNEVVDTPKSIQFSIQKFIGECLPIPATNCSLAGLLRPTINHVYYAVYKDDKQVRYIHQDKGQNQQDFGIISDTLTPGNYTVVIFASTIEEWQDEFKGKTFINSKFAPVHGGHLDIFVSPLGDVFYKKMQVVISKTEEPGNKEIVLDRLTGRIKVDLPDANTYSDLPTIMSYIPIHYYIERDTLDPQPYRYELGARNTENYLFGSKMEISVYISYIDGPNQYKTKIFEHVKCEINKETIIGGNLYATSPPYIPPTANDACGYFISTESATRTLPYRYIPW